MAELVITQLRRTGSGVSATPVEFRWTSATHSSMQGTLDLHLKVNTVRRMPAGAEQPVEQVMSVEWPPFTVEGEWNDKWAGAGFALAMRREFPRAVGQTMLARLQIDQESLVGLITDVTTKYVTRDRTHYSFTFSPHVNEAVGSFQQSANKVPTQPLNQRIDNAVEHLDDLLTASEAASQLPTRNLDIEDTKVQLATVSDSVDQASAAVLAGVDQDEDPNRALLVAASAFRSVRDAALDMMDAVSDKRSDVVVAFPNAIVILQFDEWRTTTLRTSVLTVGSSRDAELDLRARASKNPRAVHHAKAGESLERISLRYYGTADNWRAIFDANNLGSLVLDGGELLLIPERAS